jgi:hypothetical protein
MMMIALDAGAGKGFVASDVDAVLDQGRRRRSDLRKCDLLTATVTNSLMKS